MKKSVLVLLLTLAAVGAVSTMAFAAETAPAAAAGGNPNGGMIALAAALAVAVGALGTAWAQSRIGSAAAGAMAERPEVGGQMLIFLALPETMVILGFLVAFFLIGKI
jgi:V/A-type H+-transporting ATPase subunit K